MERHILLFYADRGMLAIDSINRALGFVGVASPLVNRTFPSQSFKQRNFNLIDISIAGCHRLTAWGFNPSPGNWAGSTFNRSTKLSKSRSRNAELPPSSAAAVSLAVFWRIGKRGSISIFPLLSVAKNLTD